METSAETNTVQAEEKERCMSGSFCWNELMTKDTEAAAGFYTRLFGWKTKPFEGGEMPYTIFAVNEKGIGGLMASPDPQMAPQWMPYVLVEDVDGCVKTASELGATVCLPPKDVPSVGRIAVIQDPQGVPFGVIHPAEED